MEVTSGPPDDVSALVITRRAWRSLLEALEGYASAQQRERAQDLLVRTAPQTWCDSLDHTERRAE